MLSSFTEFDPNIFKNWYITKLTSRTKLDDKRYFNRLNLVEPISIDKENYHESGEISNLKILGNNFHRSLLMFAEDAEEEEDFYGVKWKEALKLVHSFSTIFTKFASYRPQELTESHIIYEIRKHYSVIPNNLEPLIENANYLLKIRRRNRADFSSAQELAPVGVANVMKQMAKSA
jgi:hypothetical protein